MSEHFPQERLWPWAPLPPSSLSSHSLSLSLVLAVGHETGAEAVGIADWLFDTYARGECASRWGDQGGRVGHEMPCVFKGGTFEDRSSETAISPPAHTHS